MYQNVFTIPGIFYIFFNITSPSPSRSEWLNYANLGFQPVKKDGECLVFLSLSLQCFSLGRLGVGFLMFGLLTTILHWSLFGLVRA